MVFVLTIKFVLELILESLVGNNLKNSHFTIFFFYPNEKYAQMMMGLNFNDYHGFQQKLMPV